MKVGRIYQLTVELTPQGTGSAGGNNTFAKNNALVISFPITLQFDIQRNTFASANTGRFRIRNLNVSSRQQIFHDRYNTLLFRRVILRAGYEGEPILPVVFRGNMVSAYSWREGTDWITEIECFDGGFAMINGQINQTFPSGYNTPALIAAIVKTLPNVAMGGVGEFLPDQSSRGITLSGNSWDVMRTLSGETAQQFIDEEKVYVLGENDYIRSAANSFSTAPDNAFKISSESGLLGTPRRFDVRIDVNMLFEPQIGVGMLVQLESAEKVYSGLYKVIGVNHRGVISGAVSGDAITTLNLWKGTSLLRAVVGR
jgi:hypothetical protein